MAGKRCSACAQLDCKGLECVFEPAFIMKGLPSMADLAPADLWLQGWRPQDDHAFNLEFRVRGRDVVG
jgi:hypothetical protein